jgi:hypothetical protein
MATDAVDLYNIHAHRWSKATLSTARSGAVAVAVGGKILIAGGGFGNPNTPSDAVDIFDTATGRWSAARLSAGGGTLTATVAGRYALFATADASQSNKSGGAASVDLYDSLTGRWSVGRLPGTEAASAAISVAGKAIFVGYGYPYSSVVDIFDPATAAWTSTPLPQSTQNVVLAASGDQAVLLSQNNLSGKAVADIYNTRSDIWSTLPVSGIYGADAGATVDGKAVFVSGDDPNLSGKQSVGLVFDKAGGGAS